MLALLHGIARFGDRWDLVASHVGSKTQARNLHHFICLWLLPSRTCQPQAWSSGTLHCMITFQVSARGPTGSRLHGLQGSGRFDFG